MKDICTNNGKEVFTTTLVIAEGVGNQHYTVMNLIKSHSGTETLSSFEKRKVSRGGRPVEYAVLTEVQATFLITLMRNSEKVVEFKEKLTREFFRQRQLISELVRQQSDPNWQNVRKDGKAVYMQKTDVIKKFVDYATEQGSKNSRMYYANLAKMENNALFFLEQKYKNVREILTIKQLMQVATADDVIEKALKEGMDKQLNYKECYKLAKDRIIAFAEIIGKSPVQGLLK
jgi:phage regulator Rha-like protein